jgi:hypothetical protein
MGGDDFTLSTTSLQMHQTDYSRTRRPGWRPLSLSTGWLCFGWPITPMPSAWKGSPLLSSCLHSNEVATIPTRPGWIHPQLVPQGNCSQGELTIVVCLRFSVNWLLYGKISITNLSVIWEETFQMLSFFWAGSPFISPPNLLRHFFL